MRTTCLPSGQAIPVLGQGTWGMGEDRAKRREEITALRLGLDLGMTLIDTAEMYGEGGAEEMIAEAIAGRRAEVFLVSKVYPYNATRAGAIQACERSLTRLQTEYLDLYLLHWRGSVPLTETLDAFRSLKQAGKIRDYGVSNFDLSDMQEARAALGGDEIATNQVLYNLRRRSIEWDVLPWCRERAIPIMAYSPIDQPRGTRRDMLGDAHLKSVASRHGATPSQVALAWLLHQNGMIVIPKAVQESHVRENRAALELTLTEEDVMELDRAFPPPRKKTALEMK